MKKITQFSVQYPVSVIMLVSAVLLLGFVSFDKLGMDLFPDLNTPRIFVELKAGERPPSEIEKQFVKSIESLSIRQKGVTQVYSVSKVGAARITVEYTWDADMDEAFLDLQKALTDFNQNQELDELILTQHDPNTAPLMLIGFSHPEIDDMDALRKIAGNYIRNELTRQEGIASVDIIGGEEKVVMITPDPLILESLNLTISAIANQITAANLNASGGSVVELGKRYIIKSIGEFQALEEIGEVIVGTQAVSADNAVQESMQSQPIYLRDVAEIRLANDEPENLVRIDGKRSVALAVYKETRFNTIRAAEQLDIALETITRALPDYEFSILRNQASFVRSAVNEVGQTALWGMLLAVFVLFLFLRRIGVTMIIGIAIPISIVATFNLLYFNGLTLNIMTLGGLALGAGMLVDNAIVVMENIFRHLENGSSLRDAAINGSAEVGGAITASTLTTIIVFLPIVYLQGAEGELFRDQAWTVAFSLLSSLVVAMLVIPMLSRRFLTAGQRLNDAASIHFPGYKKRLGGLLARRNLIIAASLVLTIISMLLLPIIGSEFIPRTDGRSFDINMTLEEGSALSHTDQVVRGIEDIVQQTLGESLASTYVRVGPVRGIGNEQQSFFEDQNTATITVFLADGAEQPASQYISQLSRQLEAYSDVEFEFIRDESALQSTLGTDQAPLTIEIEGEDLDQLRLLSDSTRAAIRQLPAILSVETDFDEGRPEINFVVDRMAAGIANLSMESITSQLQDQIDGKEAGNWEYEGDQRKILVRQPTPQLRDVSNLYVQSDNRQIRLDQIANIERTIAPREIFRRGQNRVARISLQLSGAQALDHTVSDIRNQMSGITWPPNYQYKISGEEEKRRESFANLQFALLLSLALIYMVLAAQFESLIHPLTIILSVPLAAVGVIFIFLLLGDPLNVMAYIGLIMLIGIAVNDSIILVDAINQLKAEGRSLRDAILEAGQRRIRPIVMTSLTTILALLPLTFGFGDSAALRAPLAYAVIGGLVTSTLLTLVVIPCVYYVLDQLAEKSRSLFQGADSAL